MYNTIVRTCAEIVLETLVQNDNNITMLYENCLEKINNYKNTQPILFLEEDRILQLYYSSVDSLFQNARNDCLTKSLFCHFLMFLFNKKSYFKVGVLRFPLIIHAWVENNEKRIVNSPEPICENLKTIFEKYC